MYVFIVSSDLAVLKKKKEKRKAMGKWRYTRTFDTHFLPPPEKYYIRYVFVYSIVFHLYSIFIFYNEKMSHLDEVLFDLKSYKILDKRLFI